MSGASVLELVRRRRLLVVTLLSLSSGLPLGLVWIAIPTWMTQAGVDIKVVGLLTLAQAPWSFKFLWSPLMDRYSLPLLGRKRGWMLAAQAALAGLGLWLSVVPPDSRHVWPIGLLAVAIGFVAASYDIAYDAYAVELLRREEQALAVGARAALYRAAMFVSGGLAITLSATWSWPTVVMLLAGCYIPLLFVTWYAPEPEALPEPPRSMKEALWGPFLAFLGQHRALEMLAFVVLFKLSDNLTQTLTVPFLVQVGFGPADVGVGRSGTAIVATIVGTLLGGLLTGSLGLGRALWVAGLLQVISNLGYAVIAQVGPVRWVMYSAVAFELVTGGLGTGALGVFLMRLTQRRFSATQFALLSSLFSIPRVLSGPAAGLLADLFGWRDFFVFTVLTGVPGLVLLARFVPWGRREPELQMATAATIHPLTWTALLARATLAGLGTWLVAAGGMTALWALSARRTHQAFDLAQQLRQLVAPTTPAAWMASLGLASLGLLAAVTAAASLALRGGLVARHALPAASQSPADRHQRMV